MEIHHIKPKGKGGGDERANLIPLCFECHAEVALYNDKHPRGRKFHDEELRQHRDAWIKICSEHPSELLAPRGDSSVGPVQALVDELTFNCEVATEFDTSKMGALFETKQFDRAIEQGITSLLHEELKDSLMQTYRLVKAANEQLKRAHNMQVLGDWGNEVNKAQKRFMKAKPLLKETLEQLLNFLQQDASDAT